MPGFFGSVKILQLNFGGPGMTSNNNSQTNNNNSSTTIRCKKCGTSFPRDGKRVFCSSECARQANIDRVKGYYRERRYEHTRKCQACGRSFGVVGAGARTCSRTCRQELAQRARRAKQRGLPGQLDLFGAQ
jgi:predicted nucleic acid-binding Zn ribbon protein